MSDPKELKTEGVRWDLVNGFGYTGIDDPQIDADTKKLVGMMKDFHATYKGKLGTLLGEAIGALQEIEMLTNKGYYLFLKRALNTGDAVVKAKCAEVQNAISMATGEYLEFFDIELAALEERVVRKLMENPVVLKHRSWVEHIRIQKPFMLSEEVESALTKRDPFGSGAWGEFFDEFESDLKFPWKDTEKNLTEMVHILSDSQDAGERAQALEVINTGLGGVFAKYSAETLYMVAGAAAIERKERGYAHPMHGRNLSNRIPDSVADALHKAVKDVAAPLAQRFYRLKAAHLGLEKLKWSDRNATMPFADTSLLPFNEAEKIAIDAYASFSPTLEKLVRDSFAKKRIDAPATKGKQSGGFNASAVLPGNIPTEWTLLNYTGSKRDVMTLTHELGHGVHALLAGEAQGALMQHAPMAYCETASIFGEMIAFEMLKSRLRAENNTEGLLALIMGKLDDVINTTVRQIGFSNFERRVHGMDATYTTWHEPKKLSPEELGAIFQETLKELYGDVFTYEHTNLLWTYVSHFHRPFYVYCYAFGEFFTQSIYAKKDEFGDRFEPMYLDLLRAGSTKDAVLLMKPFGLDPTSDTFWEEGITVGLGRMVAEAEALSKEMGIKI